MGSSWTFGQKKNERVHVQNQIPSVPSTLYIYICMCVCVYVYIYILHNIYIYTSTLHCRGKNGSSKKIGQMTQKMIHFVPNMYVSGKISALRPCTQTVKNFWNSKKIRKLPKQRDFRICGFLRLFAGFCGFFAGFCGFSPWSFEALQIFFVLCLTKFKNMQSKS